jgi:hypothetical protein
MAEIHSHLGAYIGDPAKRYRLKSEMFVDWRCAILIFAVSVTHAEVSGTTAKSYVIGGRPRSPLAEARVQDSDKKQTKLPGCR